MISPLSEQMDLIEQVTGAVVSLEDVSGVTYEVPEFRIRQDQYFHHHPFCEFAKRAGGFDRCARNKHRAVKAAAECGDYAGHCQYGVWDLVFPVYDGEQMLLCFFLGGLQKSKPLADIEGRSYTGPITHWSQALEDELRNYGCMLTTHVALVVTAHAKRGNSITLQRPQNAHLFAVQRHIQQHFHESIGLSDLAVRLNLHPNYLGQLIKQATGKSFRELLQSYRIRKAAIRLEHEDSPITDIAYEVGFADSNYFSTVFRKLIGLTPRKYRKVKRS